MTLIDVWATMPAKRVDAKGVEQIMGRFVRTDGQGFFWFGMRVHRLADGTYDLVTLLTKQT